MRSACERHCGVARRRVGCGRKRVSTTDRRTANRRQMLMSCDFSELTVKIVKIEDMTQVKYLREQGKGTKHVTFDPNGRYVTVSGTDGILYVYSLNQDEPEVLRKLDGVIRKLEPDAEATAKAVWHPDGTAFAVAEATRDISVYSVSEWKKEKSFAGGHSGDITSLSWAPNGTMLASAGADGRIVLWETKTQRILQRYDFGNVLNLAWHPTKNSLSFTTSDGELFIYDNFVPKDHESQLQKPLQAAPIFPGPLTEISNNVPRTLADRSKEILPRAPRVGSPDSLDDILGDDDEMRDFVDDDDGAGYAEELNWYGKRPNYHLDDLDGPDNKRVYSLSMQPKAHPPLQPGSTPWAGNRRYLCMYNWFRLRITLANIARPEPDGCRLDGGPRNTPYCDCGIL